MGKVYLAGDSLLGGVPVAVKFLAQTLLNENMRIRFFREAMTCAQLGQKSMHVVRVTDYGVNEDDIPFYVMEYLKGENIGRLVHKQPLPVPRFLGLVRQILLGLRTAHNGILVKGEVVPIIHRDIKPSNILVTSDPSMGELVKILDFGIAKLLQAGSEQTSTFMGTLAYASPEQMEGRELDSRSDIYSLGVMMYQMLSGKLPIKPINNTFGGWYKVHRLAQPKSFADFDPIVKVPKALEDIVMDCLAKQREDRPKNIDQVIDALAPLEDRFGSGFQISQRINTTLSKLPVNGAPGKKGQTVIARSIGTQSIGTQAQAIGARDESQNSSLALEPIEHLFEEDFSISGADSQSRAITNKVVPDESDPVFQQVSSDNYYLQQIWPPEMPIAQIVFPRLLNQSESQGGVSKSIYTPTLWAMMPVAEIEKRIGNTRYNNFMCTMTPHPMVLWLSAFYNKIDGPRWLPCYLDLKLESSQNMLWTLAETRQYRILFFSQESPHSCLYVRVLNVAAGQRKLFKEWATAARCFSAVGSPQESKMLLKRELETNLKSKILMNFEAIHSDSQPGLDISLGF